MKRKYKRIGFTATQKAELWTAGKRVKGLSRSAERSARARRLFTVICHLMAVFDRRLDDVADGRWHCQSAKRSPGDGCGALDTVDCKLTGPSTIDSKS